MSEQAEATSPTATEETVTEASPPRAAEASEAEATAAPAPEGPAAEEAAPIAESEAAAAATGAEDAKAADEAVATEPAEPAEKVDTAQAEAPPAEAPAPEASAAEAPAAEAPAAEAPAAEAPAAEAPAAETPAAEAAKAAPAQAEEAAGPAAEAPAETPKEAASDTQASDTQTSDTQTSESAEAGKAAAPAAPAQPAEATSPAEAQANAGADAAGKTTEGEAKPKKEPKPLTEEEKARLAEIEALRQAKENHEPVTGRVIGWNQGGFHVVIGTITTFCPRSELELKNPKSPNYYLDKEFQFYVIKHQKKGKRIVVSRKQLLEQERAKILESMKDTLVPGKDLEGRVSSITDFGAFVDVGGGIEGLVHITELSNRRIKHPRDFVELGQEVTVRVLKVEEEGERISLSMKALEPNPYEDFAQEHPRGSKFQGKVVRKTDFGIFVELLPGLDGMVHISQLPPGKSPDHEDLTVGKEVEGWVLRVEPKRERISLSLKEVPTDDPWKDVRERYPEGSVVEGQVEDVAPFGVFIQLEPGLTGLLPNSEMNLPRGQDRSKHFPPGKKVEIQVASVDPQRKRISLAPEGAQIEGSRTDYRDYMKQQKRQSEGMTAMAAAFAKLKDEQQQPGE